MALDKETEERIEQPVSEQAETGDAARRPAEAVDQMRIRAPERANKKLRTLLERVNADKRLKGWWHVANVNATVRMEINDHSWVHIQIVTNIALKLLRQLTKHGVEPSVVRDFGMTNDDAEIVVVARRADARRRHVDPPRGPRGVQPLPRRAGDPPAARRDLRGARADRDHLRGAAGDHLPPRRRRAVLARGRDRPRRRRARHGAGPLADPVREGARLDALALGGRRSTTSRSRTARRSRSGSRS